ncbi:hypothetical protein [Haliovirga abyssi]|nr:hypothetical protein [Haliovirga abyssi]
MKKIIIICFYILFSILSFGTENYIHGKVILKNMNDSSEISVKLYSENKTVYKTYTNSRGIFFMKNIPNGDYKLKINYRDIKIEKDIKKIISKQNIGTIFIKPISKDYNIYFFSYFIVFITIILNFFIRYYIKKGVTIPKKNIILISIDFFNFYFILSLSSMIVAFFNEKIAVKINSIESIGTIFIILFMYKFFINYPVERGNKFTKLIFNLALISLFYVCITQLALIFSKVNIIKFEFNDIYNRVYNAAFFLWDIVPLFLILVLLIYMIKNIREYKNKKEAEISKFFIKIGVVIFSLIFFGSALMNRVFNVPFNDFSRFIFPLVDIILFWGILTGAFGFRYQKRYKMFTKIFYEVLNYLIILLFLLYIMNYIKLDLVIIVMLIFILKGALDYIKYFFEKRAYIEHKKLIRKLEVAENILIFKKILEKDLFKILKVNKIKIVTKDEINKKTLENIYNNEKLINLEKSDDDFSLLLKIGDTTNTVGAIYFGDKLNGDFFKRREIDFLEELGEEIEILLNNLLLNNEKNIIEKSRIEKEIKKELLDFKDIIFYIKSYVKLIKKESKNPKIAKYCEIILEKIEKNNS